MTADSWLRQGSLRELLSASGYYGERVTVHHHANPLTFSAPPHFANLVVVNGKTARNLTEKSLINIFQSVRPYGGVMCVENATTALIKTEIADAEIQWRGNNDVRIIRKGALPGAARYWP